MRTPVSALLCVLAALAIGCTRRADVVMASEASRDVPERYRFLYKGFVPIDDEPLYGAELPFERIELAVTSFNWFADNPPAIQLCRDGTAKIGSRRGRVLLFDYGRLCQLLEHVHFESLAHIYDWGGYDAQTECVTVWPAGGGPPIRVYDTGDAGPIELWAVRAAIEGVVRRVRWEKADQTNETQGK